jgi:hypothetical protein
MLAEILRTRRLRQVWERAARLPRSCLPCKVNAGSAVKKKLGSALTEFSAMLVGLK